MTAFRGRALVALLGLIMACGDSHGPSRPLPGSLQVVLTTPYTDDGALLVSITGPAAPLNLAPVPGLRLFQDGQPGTTTVVAVTGPMVSGAVLTLQVADTRKVRRYRATLVQAASSGYQVRDPAGYRLKVTE